MAQAKYLCPKCHHHSFSAQPTANQSHVFNCHNCGQVFANPILADSLLKPPPEPAPLPAIEEPKPPQSFPTRLASFVSNLFGNLVVGIVVIGFLILAYSYGTLLGTGSMEPNFSGSDVIWKNPFAGSFQRGDIIVFPDPTGKYDSLAKRIVGLPGENVRINKGVVHINSRPLNEPWIPDFAKGTLSTSQVTLKNNQYYVLGDNRRFSLDSTEFGPIPYEYISSKVFLHLDINPIDINFGSRLRTRNRSSTTEDAWQRMLKANSKARHTAYD